MPGDATPLSVVYVSIQYRLLLQVRHAYVLTGIQEF